MTNFSWNVRPTSDGNALITRSNSSDQILWQYHVNDPAREFRWRGTPSQPWQLTDCATVQIILQQDDIRDVRRLAGIILDASGVNVTNRPLYNAPCTVGSGDADDVGGIGDDGDEIDDDGDDMNDPIFNGEGGGPPMGDDVSQQTGVVLLSALVPVVRSVPAVFGWLRGIVTGRAVGSTIAIPGWVKSVLTGLGVAELIDTIIIDIPDIGDIVGPIFGGDGGGSSTDPHTALVNALTIGTWQAGQATFHRLSDGRYAVQNKHGKWTIWRPKKPTVIYASGPNNINDVMKADAILDKQAKKLAKTLSNRGYQVRKKVSPKD